MTAFADYLDLRTAVIEQVARPDITDVFYRLTKLAEARFNREFRLRDQITSTTVSVSGGTAALPSDVQEIIGLYDPGTGCEYTQRPIQQVQGTNFTFYAVDGSDIIARDGDKTLQYYATIPTITDSMTDTNWLLTKYPEVYLYGVSVEAAKHIRDLEALQVLTQFRDDAMSDARMADDDARYARARVRLPGVTP